MKWTSILAIYTLFWVFSAFLVLPFGVKTHDEAGIEKIPGQAESAPADFRPKRIVIRATILAAALFGLYYLNYVEGWLTVQNLDFFGDPPTADGGTKA
ncbi:MAG: DUF1467 family protein [Novosphingobium sp.]